MYLLKLLNFTFLLVVFCLCVSVKIVSAQDEQGSSSDLGTKLGEIFKDVLEDTLEEAFPDSKGSKAPEQYSPSNGQMFNHYPRNLTLTWEQVPEATYDIEIDCLGCQIEGQWGSDTGSALASISDINQPFYNYEFTGDKLGRWRVRATKKGKAGTWSDWGLFSFNTASGSPQQPGYDGSGQQPADYPYGQDPYDGSGQHPADYPYGQDPYDGSGQQPADYPYGQDPYDGSGQQPGDYPYSQDPYDGSGQQPGDYPYGQDPYDGSGQQPADYPYAPSLPSPQDGQQPTQNNPQIKIIPKTILKKVPIKSTGTEGGQKSIYKPLGK